MASFSVPVRSPTPNRTAEELRREGAEARRPVDGSEEIAQEEWAFSPDLLAVLEAETAEVAKARIEEIVGRHCLVGPAEPFRGGPVQS